MKLVMFFGHQKLGDWQIGVGDFDHRYLYIVI